MNNTHVVAKKHALNNSNKRLIITVVITIIMFFIACTTLRVVHAMNTGMERRASELEQHFEQDHAIIVHAEVDKTGKYILVTMPPHIGPLVCDGVTLHADEVHIYE